MVAPELAETMRTMLHAVTQKGGTAQKLSVPGYLFAGKTGTAQKVDPVTRHYSPTNWVASFVGLRALSDPAARAVRDRSTSRTARTTARDVAGPIWQDVMIDALRWLGVPPTEPLVAAADASDKQREEGAQGAGAADDRRAPTTRSEPQPVVEAEVDGAAAAARCPDFAGMSLAEALAAARHAGVRLEIAGSGRATAQSPGPGALRHGAVCKVSFTPPG